jgi:hypothetical protein
LGVDEYMLKYIELKSGFADDGPAWIARVKQSRSGQTIYFNGRALKKIKRGTYADIESGEQYWVSGVKKDASDRHWAGSGKVLVEATAVQEYLAIVGADKLDARKHQVVEPLPSTDPSRFVALENAAI